MYKEKELNSDIKIYDNENEGKKKEEEKEGTLNVESISN